MVNEYINKRVELKVKPNDPLKLVGNIQELYLGVDLESNRPNDLYCILWDTGNVGICEIKNLIFLE